LVLCHAVTEDELIAACSEASIVVVEYPHTPIKARVIAAMTQGRAIVKCAVGLDNIEVDSTSAHGIVVCNIADYCTEEVSDHTVGRHYRAGPDRKRGSPKVAWL
jgi:D-3-phosphoglycerate dehydrogenase